MYTKLLMLVVLVPGYAHCIRHCSVCRKISIEFHLACQSLSPSCHEGDPGRPQGSQFIVFIGFIVTLVSFMCFYPAISLLTVLPHPSITTKILGYREVFAAKLLFV